MFHTRCKDTKYFRNNLAIIRKNASTLANRKRHPTKRLPSVLIFPLIAVFLLRNWSLAIADASSLTLEATEIVQLSAANLTKLVDLDLINER